MVFQRFFLTLPMLVIALLLVLGARGYIPAQPSNHTVRGMGQDQNTSMLHLQWYANGSDWEHVTRQPIGLETNNDPVQGVLVHFTEDNAGYETTTTPWVAFVMCDVNATNSSSEVDIFTMAKYRGAKSVILYSLYSETCEISPGYGDLSLEVFTTQSLNASRLIEQRFGQFGSNESYHGYFNATLLNAAAGVVGDTFALGYPVAPGFLFATLLANSTNDAGIIDEGSQNDANATGTSTSSTSSSSQDTGVAMIVLYVITGCVSALFCAVIVSGAIKAIRYPERYGPRSADPTLGGGQSRASGLGRAILDTFPIVKFRSSGNDREPDLPRHKDIESVPLAIESGDPVPLPDSVRLAQLSPTVERDPHHLDPREGMVASDTGHETRDDNPVSEGTDQTGLQSQTHAEVHGESRLPASRCDTDAPMPECIGRETCPICIVDFEEGDDLRVLPCEGKHQFHLSCVDPWLLELSASCPICRQDFRALETIILSGESVEASPINRNSEPSTPTTQNRFSRYLRFARRRQQSGDEEPSSPEV